MAIPVAQLGWMAGIVDLKGKIMTKKNSQRNTPQFVLAVDSKVPSIIRRLSQMTGTRPEFKAPRAAPAFMRTNCREHCPDAHVHVGDETTMPSIARWSVTGASMATVLSNLMPFLVVDKEYEELVEQILTTTTLAGQGATAVHGALKRLQDLGWELPASFEASLESVETR